ncbi:hypothetical protein LTR84_001479 [Exophiala bonariae]|uniref:NmrA-like domain-containing protein n=1 Tax=Exophiala bonariae TaxID=1690606 RepID=A0AAV9NG86_9EURO|nr:hypothetical protein LTR84_001479 [Exophiala bonariae]
MAPKQILVVGATGQQGLATIAALNKLSSLSHVPKVLALTRSVASPKAQALLAKFPDITLVEGDSRDPQPLLEEYPNIDSIFLVTVPPNDEQQSLGLIDAAVAHGVSHIVFSSVDRGGESISWDNPTSVPHFAAKHRIELHLRTKSENTKTCWTILRPTSFMDSYNPGVFGKMMGTLLTTMPEDCKMQFVSTHDIGIFAAKALMHRDTWAGRAISLAGDELTFQDADAVFRRVTGQPLPRTWSLVGQAMRRFIEDARSSMEFFERQGFGADIISLREEEPELQTFEMWLKQSSQWQPAIGAVRPVT